MPAHAVCARSAQCIIGPNVTFAAQAPVHTMQGHSIRSAHILFLAVPTLNVSIVFTRFERMPGNKVDSLGVPTLNGSIVFYTL